MPLALLLFVEGSAALLNFACALSVLAAVFVGPTHLKRFQDYLWASFPAQQETVQQLPELSEEGKAVLDEAYQLTATIFDVECLEKKLAIPAF
jgi:hypothetical protein